MDVRMAARPPIRRSALRVLALVAAFFVLGAAPALAGPAKVLVFTGTAGTPNASSGDIATAIAGLGQAGQFTADVSSSAADINATKLADYKAVVFVHSSGNVLDAAQETALTDYVNGGGGFVGIGETALLEQGGAASFNTLIGLAAARITGTPTTSNQDIEFLDRVHPSTRALPQTWKNTETWYAWQTNPTGTVHTVARVRMSPGIAGPDGKLPTNDATNVRFGGALATNQPQGNRAASWCRDVQQGRSFYTELADVSQENVRKHLSGAIQWASGLVRGGCKATITSNYTNTRITPANTADTCTKRSGHQRLRGEPVLRRADEVGAGRRRPPLLRRSRDLLPQLPADHQLGLGQHGSRLRHDPPLGSARAGLQQPERGQGQLHRQPLGLGRPRQLAGVRADLDLRVGPGRHGARPEVHQGRPYMYVQYYPYWGGEQGKNTEPKLGTGFVGLNPGVGQMTYKAEKRISRFTYDDATKSFVPGSEKVIFSYTSPVYSCCHNGAGMAFDSKGNLYVTNGDSTPNGTIANGTNNQTNNNTGGYTNTHPHFTIPCPGMGATTHCGDIPAAQRPAGSEPLISYGDARSTSGNTNVYEGKIIRIKPLDDPGSTPGIGTTYTIPGGDAPNGPNLFPPGSQPVMDGMAKPEIFAMGVRSTYTIHIDPKTDAITTAWIGPDQTNQDDDLGPGQDRERDDDELARATGAGRSARPATAGAIASRSRASRAVPRRPSVMRASPARSAVARTVRPARSSTAAARSATTRRTTTA